MAPTAGFNDHVTAVLELPVIVAVNCWVCEIVSEAAGGVSEIVTGMRLIMALAD
jgi:hypothetical protein